MMIEPKQTGKNAFVKPVGSVLLILGLLITPLTAFATDMSSDATVRATELQGELSSGYSAHYLAVEPAERDGIVRLTLTVNPQDNARVANRVNMWVLSPEGLRDVQGGEKPDSVAIAAGNPTVLDEDADAADNYNKEASFQTSGLRPYTVIVYSRAPVSTTYTLVADNAILVDASGQTVAANNTSEQTKPADNTSKPTEPANNANGQTDTGDEEGGDE
jgi:hypothetical protein